MKIASNHMDTAIETAFIGKVTTRREAYCSQAFRPNAITPQPENRAAILHFSR